MLGPTEFLMPSEVIVTTSIAPTTGFITNPVVPYHTPLRNPFAPPYWAPSIGFVNTPVTPLNIPLTNYLDPS